MITTEISCLSRPPVRPADGKPRLRRTPCCGANTLCSSCASSCFTSRYDLRTLRRRCCGARVAHGVLCLAPICARLAAAPRARTGKRLDCSGRPSRRLTAHRPSPRAAAWTPAVAESGVRAPRREWRWFPEPRRTAHWCVVIPFDVLPRACQHSAGRWPRTWRSRCHALPLGSLELSSCLRLSATCSLLWPCGARPRSHGRGHRKAAQ